MGRAYKVGTKVECLGNGKTIDAGVWFPTRVLRKKGIDYLLEFEGGRQLFIPAHRVRPPQPKNTEIIKVGNSIDVFFNGGWHECTAVSCNNSFIEVSFHDCSEDTRTFKSSDVRIHREFDGEYWMPKIEGWKPKLPDLSLEDPYPCLACPNSKNNWFKGSKQVKEHYKKNHKSFKIFCENCGNGFNNQSLFAAHLEKYKH